MGDDSIVVCEVSKNAHEVIKFRLGEFKGHKFVDMRIFTKDDGKEATPTKKGLAVSPKLWPQFRSALAQVEAEMIRAGLLDREDLEHE